MRRRTVLSIDKSLGEPLKPEAARIVCSKGMEQAVSFVGRFQIFALVPWAQVFTSGTPDENSYLYCETEARRKLLDSVNRASVMSIHLNHEAGPFELRNRPTISCEISFRRHGIVFQTVKLYFDLTDGDIVATSEKGHWSSDIPPVIDDLENALEDLEEASLFKDRK